MKIEKKYHKETGLTEINADFDDGTLGKLSENLNSLRYVSTSGFRAWQNKSEPYQLKEFVKEEEGFSAHIFVRRQPQNFYESERGIEMLFNSPSSNYKEDENKIEYKGKYIKATQDKNEVNEMCVIKEKPTTERPPAPKAMTPVSFVVEVYKAGGIDLAKEKDYSTVKVGDEIHKITNPGDITFSYKKNLLERVISFFQERI